MDKETLQKMWHLATKTTNDAPTLTTAQREELYATLERMAIDNFRELTSDPLLRAAHEANVRVLTDTFKRVEYSLPGEDIETFQFRMALVRLFIEVDEVDSFMELITAEEGCLEPYIVEVVRWLVMLRGANIAHLFIDSRFPLGTTVRIAARITVARFNGDKADCERARGEINEVYQRHAPKPPLLELTSYTTNLWWFSQDEQDMERACFFANQITCPYDRGCALLLIAKLTWAPDRVMALFQLANDLMPEERAVDLASRIIVAVFIARLYTKVHCDDQFVAQFSDDQLQTILNELNTMRPQWASALCNRLLPFDLGLST